VISCFLTLRCYPTGQSPWRLQARTAPGTSLGFAIDAWELHPLVIKEPSTGAAEPAPASP
jgi:beta-fructofuranosidase